MDRRPPVHQARQSHDGRPPLRSRPSRLNRLHGVAPLTALRRWLSAVDHKEVGVLYMVTALVFFLIGGIEAMLMRAQLSLPNLKVLSPEAYNQVFTMHGTTMIFLVVMPVLIGF